MGLYLFILDRLRSLNTNLSIFADQVSVGNGKMYSASFLLCSKCLFPVQDFWGTACASAGERLNIKEGSRHEKNPSGSPSSLPFSSADWGEPLYM